jgi:hypothetical protein
MSAYLNNKVYPKSSEPVNLSNRAIQDLTEGRYLRVSSHVGGDVLNSPHRFEQPMIPQPLTAGVRSLDGWMIPSWVTFLNGLTGSLFG